MSTPSQPNYRIGKICYLEIPAIEAPFGPRPAQAGFAMERSSARVHPPATLTETSPPQAAVPHEH